MRILAIQPIAPNRLAPVETALVIEHSDSFRSAAKRMIMEVATTSDSAVVKIILGDVEFLEQIMIDFGALGDFDESDQRNAAIDQMIDNAVIIIERHC